MATDQDGEQEPKPAGWVNSTSDTIGNLTTAIAAAVGPEAGAAVAMGSSLVKHAAETVLGRWSKARQRSGERVLEEAVAAGVDAEQLEEQLVASEPLVMLAGAAIDAGTRTTYEDKLRALGRALAAAVDDDALVDAEQLVVAALDDMESVHVKVLRYVAERRVPMQTLSGSTPPGHREPGGRPGEWSLRGLREYLPEAAAVIEPVVATLVRHGLLVEVDQVGKALQELDREQRRREREHEQARERGWGATSSPPGVTVRHVETRWVVSHFGEHVLDRLRGAAIEQPPSR